MTMDEELDRGEGCRANAVLRGGDAPTRRDLRQASGEAVEHDRITSRRLGREREEEPRRRRGTPGAGRT